MSQPSTPAQSAPRTRGGFEFDDDGDEQDVPLGDVQDDDVYGTPIPQEISGTSAATDQGTFDRSSKSPAQENGMTPVPVQAIDSPADLPSSVVSNTLRPQNLLVSNGVAPSDQTFPADTPSVLPKSRLAHDVVGLLEDRVKDDPRGDTAAWLELIEEYKNRSKEDEVRRTYERYFEVFPQAAEQWCAFLRWEEAADRKWHMEQIFKKVLVSVPSVEVFTVYVNYVRRRNNVQTGDTAAYRNINQTFDFALKFVGTDKDSGNLWQEYISFLKTGAGTVGGTTWQDSQKMDTLREAYARALSVPTSAILPLWKEYEAFEMGINKVNGRKLLAERSPDYMTARGAHTQLQNITRGIDRTTQPRLPPALGYAGDMEYQNQVKLWKEWIEWEKEDPLQLRPENNDAYLDRIIFTYKQALMALQFWPEMWYDAAEFSLANNRDEQGLLFLNQGFASNPESALLAFKLADRLETTTTNDNTNDSGAKNRMKTVRDPYDKVLDALYATIKKTETRMEAEVQRIEKTASSQHNESNGQDQPIAPNIDHTKSALEQQVQTVKDQAKNQSDMLSKIISHVWVALMRASRRIQGKGLPNEKVAGFRAIFNEARKRGHVTPEFYVEAALIEWICYRDPTGSKILERGAKLYPDDAYLPLEYIKHLIQKEDVTNARAVFETTVSRFTTGDNRDKPESVAKTKPLFLFFHDYESKYGELSQVIRLEARMRELFPEDPALLQFSARYQTPGFNPLNAQPVISATQLVPKLVLQPSIEAGPVVDSPMQTVVNHMTNINSPKRALPADDDDDDYRPQKIARGESPFKTTQIRKVPAPLPPVQNRAPPPLPGAIVHLLSILPRAATYTDVRFDPVAMHKLIKEKHLPAPGTIGATRPPLTPQQGTPPAWPPQFTQHPPLMVPPPQGYMSPAAPPPQFGAGTLQHYAFNGSG
ncbi:mRNA 3'-end-processing protein rna14 [Lithohypha guttulata]|uniref:mRNA 3'-end-processing protein RNA14 n=1 Tax=Lithohypha guttulata TaxID=1690604 RepID=A0AAN7T6X0_9EURO|nr:mRNA 3'-end-processing protein rna14 [Lithohypha guttulata]